MCTVTSDIRHSRPGCPLTRTPTSDQRPPCPGPPVTASPPFFSPSYSEVRPQSSSLSPRTTVQHPSARPGPLSAPCSLSTTGSELAGGAGGGECPWYVSGMPRATFFSARQRTPQPGASQSEAPWQRFLRHPGKFVVGDDLHPLGLRSAKYNLMTSPGSWFHLFSPQGKHPKEDQHQVLVTGSSPNPADECFFYQATTQSVPGLENPPTIMPQ